MKKPHCSKCGRALTDPFSVAVGMGPECRGGMAKKGWKFPKPKYKVSHGRMVLVGMVGKVEPPLVVSEVSKVPKVREVKDEHENESD
jgi:hypothetical protein